MAEEIHDSISIPDKILQKLFLSLEGQEGFDNSVISQLRELAEQGDLTKADKVTVVLKTDTGDANEAH